jgi:hypothetical protein
MFGLSKKYWCMLIHKRTGWPIHGRYVCLDCGSEFPVPWDGPVEEATKKSKLAARRRAAVRQAALEAERMTG